MKTVLFTGLNSAGHLNGLLGIADRLKDDFEVRTVFVTIGPTKVRIRSHGHELVELEEKNVYEDYEYNEELNDAEKVARGWKKQKYPGTEKYNRIVCDVTKNLRVDPENGFLKMFGKFVTILFEEVRDNLNAMVVTIDKYNPDLIVVDAMMMMSPAILKCQRPWVKLVSANPMMLVKPASEGVITPPPMKGYTLLRNKEVREKMRKEEPDKWNAMMNEWRECMEKIKENRQRSAIPGLKEFYEKHGLSPPTEGFLGSHDSPYLNLYLYPREIDYDLEEDLFVYPKRWFRCDSLIRKSISQTESSVADDWSKRLEEAGKGRKEIVYFSLGSLASGDVKLMLSFLEMFKDDQERLYIVSKGYNGDKYELPSSNMIGENYVPQTFLLQRCNLAIIHGGNNTITECLHYGLPMIVLPCFGDQQDNAQRINDLGLGKRLDLKSCTKEQMVMAISEILANQETITKAREIGKKMRARDDVGKLFKILIKLIDEKHLDDDYLAACRNKPGDEL